MQTSAVDTYASYLKSVYTREKLPVYDKWPQVKSKKYINLALVEKEGITKPERDQFTRDTIHGNIDDINESKRATDIGQIAQLPDGSQLKCILVEGAPGMGKSTFAWKLCRKWGKEKLLQQYQLAVLLRLRDKSVRNANKISNLFQYHDHQIQQAAVKEIKKTGGKGVLLLFEGYDELPEELRTKNDSIFLDVITGRELPEATVLITSRPWASEFLHRECKRHLSQHFEILGFTKDNIQAYIENAIPDDPVLLSGLKRYISCYPHINSLMYIPLKSAIVVEVYRNSRKEETLVAKTNTELYSSLVRSLLLRHLLDHPVHSKERRWRVRSFDDLPQDVYQQLCELSRIAYKGILHDQQMIFSDLPEDFETLGLMQCAVELYVDEGTAVSYNFLHLTVQEYLAAFYLSQEEVEKQIEHFKQYNEHKRHHVGDHNFHMVLQFLCGITKFSGYPSEVLKILCVQEYNWYMEMRSYFSGVEYGVGTGSNESDDESDNDANVETGMDMDNESCYDPAYVQRDITFDTLHWLFEAQDSDIIANLLGPSNIQLTERFRKVTLFDCFVLGYCVSHSNCTWKIDIGSCIIDYRIGDEEVELLVRGTMEKKTDCTGGFSEINLPENEITTEGVQKLLSLPDHLINKIETLNLENNNLDSKFCATLAHLIPRVPYLKRLVLSSNQNIGQGMVVPLMTSLKAHNSLEELSLKSTGIDVEDCQALRELLSSSTSLRRLNISFNQLPPEAVELIISGFNHNTTLRWLNMLGSHFSYRSIISLALVLRTNHTLVYLCLAYCNIDSVGACQLARALCVNDTLWTLHLGDNNPIGVKGAAAFAEMLLKNKSLKELNLQDDSIGEEGTHKLIDSLKHNTTVERLLLPEKYKLSTASSGVSSRVRYQIELISDLQFIGD